MSVEVWASTQPAMLIASHMSWSRAIGGARWSMNEMPSKPAASAASARSTIASWVIRICGRNRWKVGAIGVLSGPCAG